MGKEVEKLEDHGCFKVHDLVNEEKWIFSSHFFRNKTTLHCAERKAKLFGNCLLHHLKLYSLYCEMYCQYIRLSIFQIDSVFSSRFSTEKLSVQDR